MTGSDTSSISEVKRVTPQPLVLIVMASNSKRFMNITTAPRIAAPIIPMQQFKNGASEMTNQEMANRIKELVVDQCRKEPRDRKWISVLDDLIDELEDELEED